MTIHFPDISNHQAGISLSGAAACIAKCSEGTSYRDPYYLGFQDQADSYGIPFAAYHWMNTSDIYAQARFAFDIVGPKTTLMWDCEAEGVSVQRLIDMTSYYRGLGGLAKLVYLPQWFWSGHMGSPDLRPLADAGLFLVSSNYTTYSDDGPGWAPYGGMTPIQWQHTSSQPFNGYNIDFNAYQGTVEELRALWYGGDGDDVTSGYTWEFIESGTRPVKPDTWTPEGYTSVPNNWLGTMIGTIQQDAMATRQMVADLAAKLDALAADVHHGRGSGPSD